jgi:hypothetical protein
MKKQKKSPQPWQCITVDSNNMETAGECGCKHTLRQTGVLLALFLEMFGIPLFELFNSSGGVDKFLLSCEEGMAGRADFHLDLFHDGSHFHFIATGT